MSSYYNKDCNLKKCYKCDHYEDCEVRYNTHAAPVLTSIIMGALIAFATLGIGVFIQFIIK
jgi:hypothetical protein